MVRAVPSIEVVCVEAPGVVAFGPAGVYDLIKEPTEDQIDTLDLLKLMRTRREEMEFDFEQFEALCAKTTENIVSAADQAESFSHDPNNLNAETRLFKACAVKERAAAEFSLREKLSFDRDDEYNDLIISRNLAGSYLVDEMRRLQEKMRALQTMSREARVVLDEKWDCLLYTSPSPRDATLSRMPSSA